VLVLNEGQIGWLKKRKVNLIGLRSLITDRITAMETAEKFSAEIEKVSVLKNIKIITDMYKATDNFKNERSRLVTVPNPSIFKETFVEYMALKSNNTTLTEQYAKMMIFVKVGGTQLDESQSEKISNKIMKHYPLMRMLHVNSYMEKEDIHEIINYIEQIDA
jgi:dipeptide/tripeptide permease